MLTYNSSWMFKLDHVHCYSFSKKVFTVDECHKIIELSDKYKKFDGTITGKNKIEKQIRDSNISWIFPDQDSDWIFKRLVDSVNYMNDKFFKFDVYGFVEGLQFTHYKAPSGHYGKHVDNSFNNVTRKLSLTVQLSDPKDYDGGDLNFYTGSKPTTADKEQGMIYLFPSYILHEVTPVTRGERKSLVGWITGPSFK